MTQEEAINTLIQGDGVIPGQISDGYHTFDELYEHRIRLFITVCKLNRKNAWMSANHSDGSGIRDWFVLGLYKVPGYQITYHLPEQKYWAECASFAEVLESAPEFDGHTSADVLKRLESIL